MRPRPPFGLLALVGLVAGAGCATTPGRSAPAQDLGCDAVRGAWEGSFATRGAGAGTAEWKGDLTVRLLLRSGVPKVYLLEQGRWMEAKKGSFVARCLGPSAVIHSIDTERDADGAWYESWVLAVTKRSDEELLVRWVRMVNNGDVPLTNESSKFSYEGVGLLRAVPLPSVATTCPEKRAETVGELLEWACDCGEAEPCELLAVLAEREGGDSNLLRAGRLRQRACNLGRPSACPGAK